MQALPCVDTEEERGAKGRKETHMNAKGMRLFA